jgi:hypothetical protein
VVLLRLSGRAIGDLQFDDGRRINDAAVALPETAGAGGERLLSDAEMVGEREGVDGSGWV